MAALPPDMIVSSAAPPLMCMYMAALPLHMKDARSGTAAVALGSFHYMFPFASWALNILPQCLGRKINKQGYFQI